MGHRWKGADRVELPYTANTNNNNNNNNSNNEETRQDSDWLPVPAKIHVKKFITPILLFPPPPPPNTRIEWSSEGGWVIDKQASHPPTPHSFAPAAQTSTENT